LSLNHHPAHHEDNIHSRLTKESTMPDPTCPHLAPIGGWCRLGTNFKCPAKANRVDCPHPDIGSIDQRSSERHMVRAIPERHNVFEILAEPFAPATINWQVDRVSRDRRRALVRASINAGIVMERLDAVVGTAAWSDSYDITPADAGTATRVQCSLTILGVTKQDVIEGDIAQQSTRELVQQALRQTATKFGIGRYLEKLEGVWVDYDDAARRSRHRRCLNGRCQNQPDCNNKPPLEC
jgi:hypothetical protein